MPVNLHIRLRRGSEADLLASTDMQIGEVGFATDSKGVFTFDGISKHLVGKATVDVLSNRPGPGLPGRFYYATDTETLYLDVVTSWAEIKTKVSVPKSPIFMMMGA